MPQHHAHLPAPHEPRTGRPPPVSVSVSDWVPDWLLFNPADATRPA